MQYEQSVKLMFYAALLEDIVLLVILFVQEKL